MVQKLFFLFIFACLANIYDQAHHQSPNIFIKFSSKSGFFPVESVKVNKRAKVNVTEVFAKAAEECNRAAKITEEAFVAMKKLKDAQKGVVSNQPFHNNLLFTKYILCFFRSIFLLQLQVF